MRERLTAPVMATLAAAAFLSTPFVLAPLWLNGGLWAGRSTSLVPQDAHVQVQQRANGLFEEFNGTQQQREAGSVLQAWELNGGMDACMSKRGHPEWDWSELRNGAPRTAALATSLWFKAPMSSSYSNAMADIVFAIRAEEDARLTSPPAAQIDAIDACIDLVEPASESRASAVSAPMGVPSLRDAWWSMLEALDSRYGDSASYESCFVESGDSQVSGASMIGSNWQQYLADQLPSAAEIPIRQDDVESYSRAWVAFLAEEARLENADWSCRSDVYNDHMKDVDAAVEEFGRIHADAIAQARRGWAGIERDARGLGFTGGPGSLGDRS